MKLGLIALYSCIGLGLLVAAGTLILGCSLHRPAPYAAPADSRDTMALTADGSVRDPFVEAQANALRVGGALDAQANYAGGTYRAGTCRIPTPLPAGYPHPTPPSAIELKRYPMVRRAEIGGSISPDWGMNLAFFPLFKHIKRRGIAMTSPVEMNYQGMASAEDTAPDKWTMSFLYREPDLGPEGVDPADKRILVEDIPPVTVLAIGLQGPYKLGVLNEGLQGLRDWLDGQSEWEPVGEPRALLYNGPEQPAAERWSEVQIPVQLR